MATIAAFSRWLNGSTDGRVLGLYRIIFGLFMTYYCLYYHNVHYIKQGLIEPVMHFKYEGFEWVSLLPEPMMHGLLLCMGIAALMIATGMWMKPAALFYAFGLSYFTLLEKAYYNNHIYLFILLCFLLSFTDADRFFSLRGNRNYGSAIPRWQIFILQWQVCMVYFYGGIAKLSPDWLLHQEPMRTMVQKFMGYKSEAIVYFLTYGGFFIDILSPLLLFYKPLRKFGVVGYIFFNSSNSQLFNDIGIFPFVMLASLILYFDTDELPWLSKLTTPAGSQPVAPAASRRGKSAQKSQTAGETPKYSGPPPVKPWVANFLLVYWACQLLLPFRGFFLPNQLDYTTIGNRFSWRMKIDTRGFEETAYYVSYPDKGEEKQIRIDTYLNPMQIRLLSMDPRATADFARFLREDAVKRGAPANLAIKAKIKFSYNGREPRYFVDPERDLSTVTHSVFQKLDWMNNLE